MSLRKLGRRMFAISAIASLVLCLATLGLWVRSFWFVDIAGGYDNQNRDYSLISHRGSIHFMRTIRSSAVIDGFYYQRDAADRYELGSSMLRFDSTSHARGGMILFPRWSLALVLAIVPTLWLIAILRARRRAAPGCCARCGYDLRATPDRCPECGTVRSREIPVDTEILNIAMTLAMEWGPDWMRPTQGRLSKRLPKLDDKALDDYDATARAAMTFGHTYVYDHPSCSMEQLAAAIRVGYPWISDKNVSSVYSQGYYYARKDGVTE